MILTLDDKRALCAARVTLNGAPAIITGARNPFATVASLKGPQHDATFSWPAAARIVARGGTFNS